MAKILIVDDDVAIGMMLKDILEFDNHNVSVLNQPEKTREMILTFEADLVLLDKFIAGVDGAELCKELKNDEKFGHIPVVMMSALHNLEEACKDSGAVDFITKPFDMDMLLGKVNKILLQYS